MKRNRRDYTIIPIMVGELSERSLEIYATTLKNHVEDPESLFVISSDFCHWGRRFSYTYTTSSEIPVHECIEQLDKQGMALIEHTDLKGFIKYLNQTRNTICGRYPIQLLLACLNQLRETHQIECKFTRYAQSSRVESFNQSSVSYASAFVTIQ
jgi:AmmeMemoRadiSam system protein B